MRLRNAAVSFILGFELQSSALRLHIIQLDFFLFFCGGAQLAILYVARSRPELVA